MTSKPAAFSYPVPHSTFIPISYESVTASGQTRKRKRTKSLATNASDNVEDEAEEDEQDADDGQALQDEQKNNSGEQTGGSGAGSLRGPARTAPWTPINAKHKLLPALTGLTIDGADDGDDDDDSVDERRKKLASNVEHRIRNAGYPDDIMEALPPAQPTSLQAKHLSNMNTVLHLCLIRRDWARAKRAFKLLLLSDPETDVKNLRLKTIWKLGVEILSWESERRAPPEDLQEGSQPSSDKDENVAKRDYTKTLEYLNRLVIMYPHYKHYVIGKGVNATTILPILMHFEILALQEKLSSAWTGGEIGVVQEVISGIGAVTDRLKALQETPPWVDMGDLWKLRGQLYIWASDLSLTLLNDTEGHLKHRIAAHKLSQKMKERGVQGWEEFASEYEDVAVDED